MIPRHIATAAISSGSEFVARYLLNTLQRTNISHLGKRKIIFKMPLLDTFGGYVSSLEGIIAIHGGCT